MQMKNLTLLTYIPLFMHRRVWHTSTSTTEIKYIVVNLQHLQNICLLLSCSYLGNVLFTATMQ